MRNRHRSIESLKFINDDPAAGSAKPTANIKAKRFMATPCETQYTSSFFRRFCLTLPDWMRRPARGHNNRSFLVAYRFQNCGGARLAQPLFSAVHCRRASVRPLPTRPSKDLSPARTG